MTVDTWAFSTRLPKWPPVHVLVRSKVPHQYLGSSVQSQASRSKVSPGWSMVKDNPRGHHRMIHGLFFHVAFVIQTYPFCPKCSLAHWLGTTGLVLLNLHSPFWDRCLDPGHFSKTSRMELTLPPTWKPQPHGLTGHTSWHATQSPPSCKPLHAPCPPGTQVLIWS